MANLRFAKVCHDIPFACVQQREYGNTGIGIRAHRNVQTDDPTWKRRDDFAIGQFQRGLVNGSNRPGALSRECRQSA